MAQTEQARRILADELGERMAQTGRPAIGAFVDGFQSLAWNAFARHAESPAGYYMDAFDYTAPQERSSFPTKRLRLPLRSPNGIGRGGS